MSTGHRVASLHVSDNARVRIGDDHHYSMSSLAHALPTVPAIPSAVIPFRRDRSFVHREVFDELWSRTQEPGARVALVGLGGTGKSQLAIEYAWRTREQSPQTWVFWVHASDAVRFTQSYQQIGRRLELPGYDKSDFDALGSVHAWLESHQSWAMVLDNADDIKFLTEAQRGDENDMNPASGLAPSLAAYLPLSPNGALVITSRVRRVAEALDVSSNKILEVGPLTPNEADQLLNTRLEHAQCLNTPQLRSSLISQLDYIPLAISQAAAYIRQRAPRVEIEHYLALLRSKDLQRSRLLERTVQDPRRDEQASNSIISTWYITFDHLSNECPSAARLLLLMSMCDRQGIPIDTLGGQYSEEVVMDQCDSCEGVHTDDESCPEIERLDNMEMPIEVCDMDEYVLHVCDVLRNSRRVRLERKQSLDHQQYTIQDALPKPGCHKGRESEDRPQNGEAGGTAVSRNITIGDSDNDCDTRASLREALALMSRLDLKNHYLRTYCGASNAWPHGDWSRADSTDCENINLDLEDDLEILKSYNLIHVGIKKNEFSMHPLVQFATKHWLLQQNIFEEWFIRCISALEDACPEPDGLVNWPLLERLYPHIVAIYLQSRALEDFPIRRPTSCVRLAKVFYYGAVWASMGTRFLESALIMAVYSVVFLDNHVNEDRMWTARSLRLSGLIWVLKGHSSEAESDLRNALLIIEHEHEMGSQLALNAQTDLADVLVVQDKWEEALQLQEHIVEARQASQGADHIQVLESKIRLARYLIHQSSSLTRAHDMLRLIWSMERVAGFGYYRVTREAWLLAEALKKGEHLEASEEWFEAVTTALRRCPGPYHRLTLLAVRQLDEVRHLKAHRSMESTGTASTSQDNQQRSPRLIETDVQLEITEASKDQDSRPVKDI